MKKKNRQKLFSVTAADCKWEVFRGSGKGGQKKQKTSSAVRCSHEPSGAVGESQEHREQSQNKKVAFERMANTAEFQTWLKVKIDAYKGNIEIEEQDDTGKFQKRKLRMDEV